MVLKDIPTPARPREKLLARGAASLADVELIALLLRTGRRGASVLQLAQELLEACGGMHGLLQAQPADLARIKGLGPAKRAEIAAVVEIGRRALTQELSQRPVFDAPASVKRYVQMHLGGRPAEVFAVMFIDARQRLIAFEEMFHGTLTHTCVHPREVARRALELHAAAVIVAHNHPTGAAEPSQADEALTQTLSSALRLIDVRVLDHLVVGRAEVVSFVERGLL